MDKKTQINSLDGRIEKVMNEWGVEAARRGSRKEEIQKWLHNFDVDQIPFACLLMEKVKYYSYHDMLKMVESLSVKITRILNSKNELDTVLFFPLGKGSNSSGGRFLYKYSKELGFDEKEFLNGDFTLYDDHPIVFIDDIIGSGHQAVEFYEEHKLKERTAATYYIALLGTEVGIKYIEESKTFTGVFIAESLSAQDMAFTEESSVFGEHKDRLKTICEYWGKKIYPRWPLGYNNDSSLVVFADTVPDNTLPVIWASNDNEAVLHHPWKALFNRIKRFDLHKDDDETEQHSTPSGYVYFYLDGFTDRREIVKQILHAGQGEQRIISVYGQKGIGKSTLFSFLYKMLSQTGEDNSDKYKEYTDDILDLREQLQVYCVELRKPMVLQKGISRCFPNFRPSSKNKFYPEFAIYLKKRVKSRKLILILNNLGTSHCPELNALYLALASKKMSFCIITGSITPLPLFEFESHCHINLDLPLFRVEDIYEYVQKHKLSESGDKVMKLLEATGGLPLYLKLLCNRFLDSLGGMQDGNIKAYMEGLLQNLKQEKPKLHEQIERIALLSVTDGPYFYTGSDSIQMSRSEIETLAREYSLIEYDGDNIRMHDIVRDYIIQLIIDREDDKCIRSFASQMSSNPFKYSFYLLLLYIITRKEESVIISAIEESVKEENFGFLISLGRFFITHKNKTGKYNPEHIPPS